MPRSPREITNTYPYHIYNRGNNKNPFPIPIEECWDLFCELLNELNLRYGFHIFDFVLMTNHFHINLLTPHSNLSAGMQWFLSEITRRINKKTGRINHFFGGRYGSTVIKDSLSYAAAYKYLYRNPVKAKMVSKVENYPYSTLNRIKYKNSKYLILSSPANSFSCFVPKHKDHQRRWLNVPFKNELEKPIQSAFNRRQFKISKRYKVRLEKDIHLSIKETE